MPGLAKSLEDDPFMRTKLHGPGCTLTLPVEMGREPHFPLTSGSPALCVEAAIRDLCVPQQT